MSIPHLKYRRTGFTLVEVLIAIGIFGIGMVAVAAIFPTAITIQRSSNAAVDAMLVVDNATAYLKGNPLIYTYDISDKTGDFLGSSYASGDTIRELRTYTNFEKILPLSVRSYLDGISDSTKPDYVWYPVVQNHSGDLAVPEWITYIFVIRPDKRYGDPSKTAEYLTNSANLSLKSGTTDTFSNSTVANALQPGDWLLTSTGIIARVTDIDDNDVTVNAALPSSFTVWYAKPATTATTGVGTCHQIAVVGDAVNTISVP